MPNSSKTILLITCVVCLLMSGEAVAVLWTQTTWEGGPGQELWGDTTMYDTDRGMDWESTPGDLMLRYPGWENTGELTGAIGVEALAQGIDGSLYAGTCCNGDVFKSTDAGTTWVNTGELSPGVRCVCGLLQASDGAIYAGVPVWSSGVQATVFKTTDGGATWFEPGTIPDHPGNIYELIEAQDGAIYASGDHYAPGPQWPGAVFKTTDGGVIWTRTGDLDSTIHVWTVFQAVNGTIYAGADCHHVFWTTDGGANWNWTGPVPGFVYEFVQDYEGALYAGVEDTTAGSVLKSTDAGTTWVKMVEWPESESVQSLLRAFDGSIYAGTFGFWESGEVYRSTDAGTTWVQTGDLEGVEWVMDLLQASDGTIYAGTRFNGDVFRCCPPQGDLVSSVYDAGPNPEYGIMSWDETLNGQSLLMKVRTDTLSDMSTALEWGSCPPAVNGDDLSSLSSVDDGDPYIQYRLEMVSTSVDSTPVLHEVRIEYSPTGVEELSNDQLSMTNFQLLQNHPNPFRHTTVIRYTVRGSRGAEGQASNVLTYERINLSVYDLSGRLVRTLVDEPKEPGTRVSSWDGRDQLGEEVPSGLYFYRLSATRQGGSASGGRAEDQTATKKMMLLR